MSKRRLLLADDSVTIQKVVNLTFAEEGIEVITAGDGNTAMEKFVQSPPDLVMVDVNMPGFDGYKICEMIKQDEETKQIPVILLVGSFEPFDEAEARRVGADDFLTKPFQSIRQLVTKVSDLLNRPNGNSVSNEQNMYHTPPAPPEMSFQTNGNTAQTNNQANFSRFDESGIDDEMIQTDQIGSLPADESQKFISEPNFQFSDNYLTDQNSDAKESIAKFEPANTIETQKAPTYSDEDELLKFDEKVFDFTAENPTPKTAAIAEPSNQNQQNQSNIEKFPEYSAFSNDNNAMTDNNFSDSKPFSTNDSIFDFDDLNLLDLPPVEKKTAPVAEEEPIIEQVSAPPVVEPTAATLPEPEELIEKYDSKESTTLSTELIEAIAQRVMEKLSDKVVKEIVQGVSPQTVESLIKEMAQKKAN